MIRAWIVQSGKNYIKGERINYVSKRKKENVYVGIDLDDFHICLRIQQHA